jgi:hypothetical protein
MFYLIIYYLIAFFYKLARRITNSYWGKKCPSQHIIVIAVTILQQNSAKAFIS